ncbi:Thioredoxin domain-containing protein EC-YbbN [Halorhodospira halochloris]|uniref:Thioredoxin n=1 Tax=Halorhodospira halochloris TaxID=1052 RepID=A0A0X8X6E6_HALHR|nr:thioredoxin [Halorhodospira halochloris]MBK1651067.1 thioredoxin [Halorhodospira halochloris]BAU56419.1 Thioredoxin domain-containing protein EC-YbbN [Halorhodospira halochloris]
MSDSPYVIDITADNFKEQAIDASLQQPVLLYFWAQWCEPCKSLGPTLEKLADEFRGGFRVAKVDCDQEQQLAMQVGVQSLPTALLIKDGQPVDQFMGAVPEGELRKWLEQYVEAPAADPMEQAKELLAAGRSAEALPYLRQAHQQRQDVDSTLELAKALMHSGETEEAFQLVDGLSPNDLQDARAQAILKRKELAEQVKDLPPLEELEKQVAESPGNHLAKINLAMRLVVAGGEVEALEHLLEVLQQGGDHKEDAHQAMLKVLAILGPEHPEARRYRQRLFQLLH